MAISELNLNGILHLFSILSSGGDSVERQRARELVETYLVEHLKIINTTQYMGLFDSFLELYEPEENLDFLAERSQGICDGLRGNLERPEQYAALFHFLELARRIDLSEEYNRTLSKAVSAGFKTTEQATHEIFLFLQFPEKLDVLTQNHLAFGLTPPSNSSCRFLHSDQITCPATVLYIEEVGLLYLKPHCGSTLSLNGSHLSSSLFYLLSKGDILRDNRGYPLYYSEIADVFVSKNSEAELIFAGNRVDFRYPNSSNGLHDFSFSAHGGQMIGIMGGSGVGKSTLMSILNGTMEPDSGKIFINNRNLYQHSKELEGVIGMVPQDDLLFDELTVYENLYSSSKLCLSHLSDDTLRTKVTTLLEELRQLETKDLLVGSPLDKTISGGQRKRLNIALELIREPSILFVDEPTSGLSSADSFNVISLLKGQANKGKLVLVIIHQPSSDLFKMFDQLWVMDKGGRPIFTGNPIDAVLHFRDASRKAGHDECLCPHCGNINPEQIFDIIEAKQLDENGFEQVERTISAQEWHELYLKSTTTKSSKENNNLSAPKKALNRPSLFGQLGLFFRRNVLTRVSNKQYLLINVLEAPLLAWVIAMICRYESVDGYSFGSNHNVPVYLFMSIIVSLFMGLSVSAEEIIRDRKILKREKFLHLSWFSYINAKAVYLCMVSAIQTFLYVLVGNSLLNIPDLMIPLWLLLFSLSVCSCMIGLNISAWFKTIVTIYILIPLILVPQIILGGMVVSFDDLIPRSARSQHVPFIGNIMPSRWGFEAIMVKQYQSNQYQVHYNEIDRHIDELDYVKNYYIQELLTQLDFPFTDNDENDTPPTAIDDAFESVKNGIDFLNQNHGLGLRIPSEQLSAENYNRSISRQIRKAFLELTNSMQNDLQKARRKKREITDTLTEKLTEDGFETLRDQHENKSVVKRAQNSDNFDEYRVTSGDIIRLSDPIASQSLSPSGGAPFMAGEKRLGSLKIPTYQFNLGVLWGISFLFYTCLYGKVFSRLTTLIKRLIRVH